MTLWSTALGSVQGWVFLDLDATGNRHQTLLEKLNESSRFIPLAVGNEGRIQLVNIQRVSRVTLLLRERSLGVYGVGRGKPLA